MKYVFFTNNIFHKSLSLHQKYETIYQVDIPSGIYNMYIQTNKFNSQSAVTQDCALTNGRKS